jgi:serine/threonine-protein kinase
LSEKLVLKYLLQLLSALEVAHKQSIWHLDIKPENIMVDRYGHTYLIDFGASKHIEQNSTLTTSLALAYTRGYCPPELADLSYGSQDDLVQALKDIGPWTDFYALGATMYNLLTDNIPPSSNRLYKDGRNAFMFPSNVSSSTRDLIVWMMKPNQEERPQTVEDIQRQLNRAKVNSESTIIDRNEYKTSEVTQPYSSSTTYSSSSQSEGSEKWYIIWVIFLTILCIWGGCTNRWVICAIGGVGLFVSGWVKTLFFDK